MWQQVAYKKYSALHFGLWRIFFGIVVCVYITSLIPYVGELFSAEGMSHYLAASQWALFLNFSVPTIEYVFYVLFFLCLCFVAGVYRRASAFFLWLGWISMAVANPLLLGPVFPYFGWLLLACVVIPEGEPLSLDAYWRTYSHTWYMPGIIYWGAWTVLGVTYAYSVYVSKLSSHIWREGNALMAMYYSDFVRGGMIGELVQRQPLWLIKTQTWATLFIQGGVLPLMLHPVTRPFIWLGLSLMFFLAFIIFNFSMVLLFSFVYLAFLFDISWYEYIVERIQKWQYRETLDELEHTHT